MDDVNRCVCCGAIIPEGRMVCPTCEKDGCVHLWEFDGLIRGQGEKNRLRWKCSRCGMTRISTPPERTFYPG